MKIRYKATIQYDHGIEVDHGVYEVADNIPESQSHSFHHAQDVIEEEDIPRYTGLVNHRGEKLYAYVEKDPIGFICYGKTKSAR